MLKNQTFSTALPGTPWFFKPHDAFTVWLLILIKFLQITQIIQKKKTTQKTKNEQLFSKYYNEKFNTDTASESKAMFQHVQQLLNKYKLNSTWKVLEAPPQLNLRQRLTLLSFSRISKVPSFHLVVPRSMLVKRILTAPPLESLGTVVAMAYYPVGALWRLGLVIRGKLR